MVKNAAVRLDPGLRADLDHRGSASALVVHPALPVKNVKELIALAKARPGELNYSSPGRGALGHLAAELFSSMAGVKMVHVPYKGAGPALVDVMAGHVQLLIAALPGRRPADARRQGAHDRADRAGARSASMPDVPTASKRACRVSSYRAISACSRRRERRVPSSSACAARSLEALRDPGSQQASREPRRGARRQHARGTGCDHKSEIAKWIKVTRAAGIEPQ